MNNTLLRKLVLKQPLVSFFMCWSFFFISCDRGDTDIIEITDESQIQNEDLLSSDTRLVEVEIDTTDLYMLPSDTGGFMTIHPVEENVPFRHLVYTPGGYSVTGPEYPIIIFLHGWGPWLNDGSDPPEGLLTSAGPSKLIAQNRWNPSYPFIVVAPELRDLYWDWDKLHLFIGHLIDNYQINERRIYLTGLSLGGGGSWYYVGKKGEESYVAAIVPISARGEQSIIENLTDIPIWAFHGHFDQTVDAYNNYGSVMLVDSINARNPEVEARLTVYGNAAHDAWTRTYENRFYVDVFHDSFEVSIYDWMLQYRKPE